MTNCVFIDYLVRRHSQGMYKKVTGIRMRKFKIQKIKYLFITIKVQLITISSIILYILETNSISNSLKKKLKREKGRGKEEKKETRMRWGRKGKGGREKEKRKEKDKKEEKEEEEEKMEKAIQEVYRPPQMHSLARS